MNPIKDDLYAFYHQFFTQTEVDYFTPNKTDLLVVPTTTYELNKTTDDCLDMP